MSEKNLYIQIYEYLLARIHFEFYTEGEPLPSIQKLSNQFNVSTMAVRSAYKLLDENGYLSIRNEKRTVIRCGVNHSKQDFPSHIPLNREGLEDIHQSFDLIFPSVYYCGLSACHKPKIEKLHHILDRPTTAWEEPTVNFLAHIAGELKNSLLLDLFYDVLLFCYPSYLAYLAKEPARWKHVLGEMNNKLRDLLTIQESGDNAALWNIIKRSYPGFDLSAAPIVSTPADSLYHWGKPQICLSAAGKIVSMIYDGGYPAGSFLPSARVMADEFSMSVITMRRTIALLNDLGIVESINGKGTKILFPGSGMQKVKWDDPIIKKNIMLYLEALHIQVITCRLLASSLFTRIGEKERAQLKEKINLAMRKEHVGEANTACLRALVRASGLSALQAVYDKLFSLLIWGQPLIYLQPSIQPDCYTEQLIISLDRDDPVLFAQTLEQSLSAILRTSRAKAVSIGIEEAGMLSLPFTH